LSGEKQWITCGQFAGVFLVFGKLDQKSLACLVPRDSVGLEIEPIQDLMDFVPPVWRDSVSTMWKYPLPT